MGSSGITDGSDFSTPGADRMGSARVLLFLVLGLYLIVLVRTAWVADDAYITFRTIENWFNGFGLRWNVVDRVQTFTHPLWMLTLSAGYAVTREPYFSALGLAIASSLAAAGLLATRVASSSVAGTLGLTILLLSKSYVDFSTSGLENPLTHLLLVLFLIAFLAESRRRRQVLVLSTLMSLLVLTRPDVVVITLPAFLVAITANGWRRSVRQAAIGFLPAVLWELFALVYYGFPFPNSYYAKLVPEITLGVRAHQGFLYLLDAVTHDPLLVVTIFAALAITLTRTGRRSWPIAAGIVLHLTAVVCMGGDFMAGRFLTPSLLFACAVLMRQPLLGDYRLAFASTAFVVLIGHYLSPQPVLLSGSDFGGSPEQATAPTNISDERMLYYQATGLLLTKPGRVVPVHTWAANGRIHRQLGTPVIVKSTMGFRGFTAGPRVYIVDDLGVTDPLIARLPPVNPNDFHPGHIQRAVPEGYVQTLTTGQNVIVDPGIAGYYNKLRVITEGPIWDWNRLKTIVRMNLGSYEYMVRSGSHPTEQSGTPVPVPEPVPTEP